MSKNIVVVTGSPRANGNSDILAGAFIEGARQCGNSVTVFHAGRMNINGCLDCKYCFSHEGECIQKDDMQAVYPSLRKADILVFASPVYWYGLSSQIKALIDRMFAGCMKPYPIASIGLLLTYGDTDPEVAAPAISHFKAISHYMDWKIEGIIMQEGVKEAGEIRGKKSLQDAENLGAGIH